MEPNIEHFKVCLKKYVHDLKVHVITFCSASMERHIVKAKQSPVDLSACCPSGPLKIECQTAQEGTHLTPCVPASRKLPNLNPWVQVPF